MSVATSIPVAVAVAVAVLVASLVALTVLMALAIVRPRSAAVSMSRTHLQGGDARGYGNVNKLCYDRIYVEVDQLMGSLIMREFTINLHCKLQGTYLGRRNAKTPPLVTKSIVLQVGTEWEDICKEHIILYREDR